VQRQLAAQVGQRSGEPLSKATLRHTLAALRAFFEWLSGQSGFRQKITYSDASYFNLSLKDRTVARAAREDRVPTLEQIHFVLNSMPQTTEVDCRNRALVALAALTAPRADALASMRLRHIDVEAGCISQDARQVRTKYSKTFPTFFVPRADRIVHDDVASGDELGQGEGGAVTHDQPAKCRREGGVSCYTF
jgi:integrase